jgi:hypothetical protein
MHIMMACEALNSKRRLELRYDGHTRIVEVHAAGRNKLGEAVMLVWQVEGGSSTGTSTGWRRLKLDEIRSAALTDQASAAPREGYLRNDPTIARILCQL